MTSIKDATKIIKKLVGGSDPTTGEPLSQETVLNRVEILRALVTAVTALEEMQTKLVRRGQLPNSVGKPWTEEEERKMISAFQSGDPIQVIADRHERTIRAIEARLERLGLLKAEDRSTAGGWAGPNKKKKDKK